ncbi:hypothetical protein MYX82_10340 [Acidobacteria bacterium AH-259-D05]|nr:hypothetical protein [Acidobacteria bacterium AH-259-D05]
MNNKRTIYLAVLMFTSIVLLAQEGWNFRIDRINAAEERYGYRLQVGIQNLSRNQSYKCPDGRGYCATVICQIVVINPDAGQVFSDQQRLEIRNGGREFADFYFNSRQRFGILEVRASLHAPNGDLFDQQSKVFRY